MAVGRDTALACLTWRLPSSANIYSLDWVMKNLKGICTVCVHGLYIVAAGFKLLNNGTYNISGVSNEGD